MAIMKPPWASTHPVQDERSGRDLLMCQRGPVPASWFPLRPRANLGHLLWAHRSMGSIWLFMVSEPAFGSPYLQDPSWSVDRRNWAHALPPESPCRSAPGRSITEQRGWAMGWGNFDLNAGTGGRGRSRMGLQSAHHCGDGHPTTKTKPLESGCFQQPKFTSHSPGGQESAVRVLAAPPPRKTLGKGTPCLFRFLGAPGSLGLCLHPPSLPASSHDRPLSPVFFLCHKDDDLILRS